MMVRKEGSGKGGVGMMVSFRGGRRGRGEIERVFRRVRGRTRVVCMDVGNH